MNNQQVFDKVLDHLRKQEKAAYDDNRGACHYRLGTKDGTVLACAVGCLIPDNLYTDEMEGLGYVSFNDKYQPDLAHALKQVGLVPEQEEFLQDLQFAHDAILSQYGLDSWEHKMKQIANEYKLEYKEPI